MDSVPHTQDDRPQDDLRRADTSGIDVTSTLLNLGRAFGDLGTRSFALSRITMQGGHSGSAGESGEFKLSESSRRYEHIRLLGRGGMGVVDQVWDHDLMRKLAVKRLHPERADRGMALRQFLWEARVTAYLDHPNIVPVHDLGLDGNGDLYFTMKFVHGTSLDEMLGALARVGQAAAQGQEPTPVDEIITAEHMTALRRVRLFLDLCQAISYAHERGVLHRDLKPANVMLGQYGEVLIMDWGLAYPLPGPTGEGLRELLPHQLWEHKPNRPSGTPRYMSPEQIAGRQLDERSDIYSLGVILYELLTLRSPYTATDFTRLLLQVSDGDVRPLTKVGASVPDALIDVVNRAMAKLPDQRYATVRELTDDIEAVLDGFAPAAPPVRAESGPLRGPVSTRPSQPALLIAAGAIGCLALVAALPRSIPRSIDELTWWAILGLFTLALGLGYLALGRRSNS
jgi:serine/threonine-protein kinase